MDMSRRSSSNSMSTFTSGSESGTNSSAVSLHPSMVFEEPWVTGYVKVTPAAQFSSTPSSLLTLASTKQAHRHGQTSMDLMNLPNSKRLKTTHSNTFGVDPAGLSYHSLPWAIWQTIMMYLSPPDRGKLLRINSAFNRHLTTSRCFDFNIKGDITKDPATPFARSCKLNHPGMLPPPPPGCSMLDMWRLIHGKTCQFCGLQPRKCLEPGKSLSPGPGQDGVSIIWPFAIRSCGRCLRTRTIKAHELPRMSLPRLDNILSSIIASEDFGFVSDVPFDLYSHSRNHFSQFFYQHELYGVMKEYIQVSLGGQSVVDDWYSKMAKLPELRRQKLSMWQRIYSSEKSREQLGLGQTYPEGNASSFLVHPTVGPSMISEWPPSKQNFLDESPDMIKLAIGKFAEDVMNLSWEGGMHITREKCAYFAISVLNDVRTLYYQKANSPESPMDPKSGTTTDTGGQLTLKHMRWVYDHKIKGIAEKHDKVIFHCSACKKSKKFDFDGTVLHYGAKHTSEFTDGSAVVSWEKSEWPKILPFSPAPSRNMHPRASQPVPRRRRVHASTTSDRLHEKLRQASPAPDRSVFYPIRDPEKRRRSYDDAFGQNTEQQTVPPKNETLSGRIPHKDIDHFWNLKESIPGTRPVELAGPLPGWQLQETSPPFSTLASPAIRPLKQGQDLHHYKPSMDFDSSYMVKEPDGSWNSGKSIEYTAFQRQPQSSSPQEISLVRREDSMTIPSYNLQPELYQFYKRNGHDTLEYVRPRRIESSSFPHSGEALDVSSALLRNRGDTYYRLVKRTPHERH